VIPTFIVFPTDTAKTGKETLLQSDASFATCGYGGVKIWDLQYTKESGLLRHRGHMHPVKCVSFNKDGDTIASTGGRYVKLWSRAGHLKKEIKWNSEERKGKWSVSNLDFTPDGKLLACVFVARGEADHVVIFNATEGEP